MRSVILQGIALKEHFNPLMTLHVLPLNLSFTLITLFK